MRMLTAAHGAEGAPGHARRVADVVAHQADDGLVLLDVHLGELAAAPDKYPPAASVLSMVSDTLTSEVETMSTGVW